MCDISHLLGNMRNNGAENAVSEEDLQVRESNTGTAKGHKAGAEEDGPA
jgi:hypothetical protein